MEAVGRNESLTLDKTIKEVITFMSFIAVATICGKLSFLAVLFYVNW